MLVYQRVSSAFKTFLDVSIKILELQVDLVAPTAVASAASFSVRTVATLWDGGESSAWIEANKHEHHEQYIIKMYKELKVIDHWYY